MAREDTIITFGAVDRISPVIDRITGNLGSLNAALAGVGAASAALVAGVARSISVFEQLGDAAIKINVSAEALSGLGFAARQSGADAAKLESGLARLNKTLGEAASGNAQAAKLFDAVGVSIRDAEGKVKSADAVFLELADRFRDYQDGAQEAALASALLGRSAGPELLQLLNQGSEGIQQLIDDGRELGVVIGDDATNAAKAFGDNIDRLKAAGEGFFNSLTTALLPALQEFSTDAAEAAQQGGLLAEAGRIIGEQFNLFGADLVIAQADIQQLGAELANGVAFVTDWAETLGFAATGAVLAFQSIEQAARGNFAAAERGLNALLKGVEALGQKAAVDAAKRMGDLAASISAIRDDAASKIARIKGGVEGLGKAAGTAAGNVGKLPPPTNAFGNEADKAAPKVRKLAQEVERLNGFNLRFAQSLKPVSEAMQALVEDIDLGAVSFDNLRESQQVLNETVTEEAQFFADNWAGAVDAATDAFADFIAGNIESFKDFGDALESIARQFLSNLVRQFLSTNLSFGSVGSVFGSSGFVGPPGPGDAGAMFGGINFGGPGAALGTRLGLGALGAGVAYAGYQRGNPLLGAAGGALTGFQVGGPVGAVVGAILGGVAAALNDTTRRLTVIGDELVGSPGFRNFAPGSTFESRLGGFTIASIDNVSADERRRLGQAVADFDNEIAGLLNAEQLGAVTDALANFTLRLEEGAITAENILGQRFDAILSTFDEDTQAFVRSAGDLEAQVAALADILSRPARLNALLESLEEADRLSGMTPFEQALDRINKEFDAATAAAEELGADQAQLARIEQLRGAAIERLNDAQRASLDALLDQLRFDDETEGLSAADRAIAEVNRRFDALRAQAIALGATQEDLELIERRRTAALREQADATRDATDAIEEFSDAAQSSFNAYLEYQADWLEGLGNALQPVRDWLNRGASVSSENPLQQLTRSQQQFEDLARRASLGDFDAIRSIAGAGDSLLRQAAQFYGVGSADFQRYEQLVRGTLTPLAGVDGAGSMAVALGQLRQIYEALLRYLQGNTGPSGGTMNAAQMQQLVNSLDRISRRQDRVT